MSDAKTGSKCANPAGRVKLCKKGVNTYAMRKQKKVTCELSESDKGWDREWSWFDLCASNWQEWVEQVVLFCPVLSGKNYERALRKLRQKKSHAFANNP